MSRAVFFILMVFVARASPVYAQSHGYSFAGGTFGGNGPGGAFRYGIGGAWTLGSYFTAGGEIGGVQKDGSGLLISGNLGGHFRGRVESGVDPFLTAGLAFVREGGGDTGVYLNVGGGMNYWLRQTFGIRAEFRSYPGWRDLISFSELRAGVCFRFR